MIANNVLHPTFENLTVARHAHGRLLLAGPCKELQTDCYRIRRQVLSEINDKKGGAREELPEGCIRFDDLEMDIYDRTALSFLYVPESEVEKPLRKVRGLGTVRIIPSYSGGKLHAHDVTKKNSPDDLPPPPIYIQQLNSDPMISWIKNAGTAPSGLHINPFIVEFSRLHISKDRRKELGYPSGISPREFIVAAIIRLTIDMHRVAMSIYPGACLEHSVIEPALTRMRKSMSQVSEMTGEIFNYLGKKEFSSYNLWACYREMRTNRPDIFQEMSYFSSAPLFEYLNFGAVLATEWTRHRLEQTEHMLADDKILVHELQSCDGHLKALVLRDMKSKSLLGVAFLNAAGKGIQELWDCEAQSVYGYNLSLRTVEKRKGVGNFEKIYQDLLKTTGWVEKKETFNDLVWA